MKIILEKINKNRFDSILHKYDDLDWLHAIKVKMYAFNENILLDMGAFGDQCFEVTRLINELNVDGRFLYTIDDELQIGLMSNGNDTYCSYNCNESEWDLMDVGADWVYLGEMDIKYPWFRPRDELRPINDSDIRYKNGSNAVIRRYAKGEINNSMRFWGVKNYCEKNLGHRWAMINSRIDKNPIDSVRKDDSLMAYKFCRDIPHCVFNNNGNLSYAYDPLGVMPDDWHDSRDNYVLAVTNAKFGGKVKAVINSNESEVVWDVNDYAVNVIGSTLGFPRFTEYGINYVNMIFRKLCINAYPIDVYENNGDLFYFSESKIIKSVYYYKA